MLVGAEVLALGLAAWVWIGAIQLLRIRDWGTMRPDLRRTYVLRVALGQIASLTLVVAGIALLVSELGGLYWLVAGTNFAILVALFDAWVLLIEINR